MGKHKSQSQNRDQRRAGFLKKNDSRAGARLSWNWMLILGGLAFVGALLYSSRPTPGSNPVFTTVEAQAVSTGQGLKLAAASFADGKARFYKYTTVVGREIKFFVLRSSDGIVRAAFDACDVCYRERKGYHQSGDAMVCNNCGRSFRSVDVNVITGGCNPGSLQRTLDGDQVAIAAASIEAGAGYF